jgi:hypothetical protein
MMKILKGVFILQQRRPKNTSQTPAAAVWMKYHTVLNSFIWYIWDFTLYLILQKYFQRIFTMYIKFR